MARLEEVCEILDSKRVPITAANRTPGPFPYYGANGVQDYVAEYIFDDELVLVAEDGGHFGSKDRPIAYRVSGKCWVNNHAHVLKPKAMIDVDYLCYSLMYRDVSDIVNGATRQKLTQADLRKIEIDVPTPQHQEKIVAQLDEVFSLISLRKQQLAKLDDLVKSQFVEMFGTPESVMNSSHTIAEVADVQVGIVIKPTRYYADGNEGIKAFRSLNIGPMYIKDDDWVYFTEEAMKETQRTVAHTDDILVVRSGSPGTSCVVPLEYDGCNVIDLIIAHPNKEKVLPKYLCAFTNMPHGMNQINSQQRGVAQKHFNVGMYKDLRLILPSLDEQKQFVDFLEQTDKSKLAVQQSIDQLETLKKSLMQKYFG